MDDNNFQQLWWSLEEARNAAKQLSLVKAVAVHRTFHCSQIVSLVDLMLLVGDKLTVVEILCLRTADAENKQRVIEVFPLAHQARVTKIMLNAYGTAQDHRRHNPHLVKHMATQTPHDMKMLNKAVDNAAFSTNCMDILRSTLRKSTTGISFQSAFQLMMRFKEDDISEVIKILGPYVLGFTCREIGRWLSDRKDTGKAIICLKQLVQLVVEIENKWEILDIGFADAGDNTRAEVRHILHDAPSYPRSFMFGNVAEGNEAVVEGNEYIIFMLDCSRGMEARYRTNQEEYITRWELVVREVTHVLKAQCTPHMKFQVCLCASRLRPFKDTWINTTPENVDELKLWLLSQVPTGSLNAYDAFQRYLGRKQAKRERIDAAYFVCTTYPNFCSADHVETNEHRANCRQWDVDNVSEANRRVILDLTGDTTDYSDVPGQHNKTVEAGWIEKQCLQGKAPDFRMHVTVVMGGEHATDEYHETIKFARMVAHAGGGLLRTVVDEQFLPKRKMLHSAKADKGRNRISAKEGRGWQAIHLITFVAMILTLSIGKSYPSGRQNLKMLIAKYPTYITPTHDTFFLTRLMAAMHGTMLSVTCLPMQRNQAILKMLGPYLALYYMCMGVWLVLIQEEWLGSACALAAGALLFIIIMYLSMDVGTRRSELEQRSERIMVHIPLSASMAWTSFLLINSVSIYLKAYDWYAFGFHYEMALFVIVLMDLIAFAILKTRRDWVFGAFFVYILINIGASHWPETSSLDDVSNRTEGNAALDLTILSLTSATVIGLESFVRFVEEIALIVYDEKDIEKTRTIAHTVRLQVTNAFTLMAMISVNLASSDWGAELLGLSRKVINHQTCGGVAYLFNGEMTAEAIPGKLWEINYNDTSFVNMRLMAHSSAWKLLTPLYFWLGFMVFVQLIPLEEGGYAEEIDKRDEALEKVVVLRGVKEKVFTPRCRICKKEYQCTIARIDEWRLTKRSQGLFHKNVGFFFIFMCMFNMFFLIAFQFKAYTSALVFISLYYASLVKVYQSVRAFRSTLSHKITGMVIKGGGLLTVEGELAKLRRRKVLEYEKVHGKQVLDDEESGGIPEEALAPTRADKEEAQERVAVRKWQEAQDAHVSWVERCCVHVPLGILLGFSTYLVLIMSFFYMLSTGWTYDGWSSGAWAYFMLTIGTLFMVGLGLVRQDPTVIIGWVIPLIAVFQENTSGTCTNSSPAGFASRVLGHHWMWHVKTQQECNTTVTGLNTLHTNPYEVSGRYTYCDSYIPGNRNCDFVWLQDKCRRVWRSNMYDPELAKLASPQFGSQADKSYQCDFLGSRDTPERNIWVSPTQIVSVKGYYWMVDKATAPNGVCVENAGTCGYEPSMGDIVMQSPAYVVATASLVLTTIALLLVVVTCLIRIKLWRASGARARSFGNIMAIRGAGAAAATTKASSQHTSTDKVKKSKRGKGKSKFVPRSAAVFSGDRKEKKLEKETKGKKGKKGKSAKVEMSEMTERKEDPNGEI